MKLIERNIEPSGSVITTAKKSGATVVSSANCGINAMLTKRSPGRARAFVRGCPMISQSPVFCYSTYFLHGLDKRELSQSQQEEIAGMIDKEPKGSSFLVYNSWEADR